MKKVLIHYLKKYTPLQDLENIKAQEDSKIKEFQKKYIKNLWCNIYKSELAYWLEEQGLGLINYLTHNSKLLDDNLTSLLQYLIKYSPRKFTPIIQQKIKEILINNNIVKDWSEEYIYNMSEVPSDQLVEYITKRPNSICSATVKKDLKDYITNNLEKTNNLVVLLSLCQIPQINNDEQLANHLQTLLFKTQEHNIDDLVKYAIDHPYSIRSYHFRNTLIKHLKNNLEDIPKCAEVFKSNKVLSRECELKEFHEIYISYLSQKENGLLDYIRLYPKDLESYNLRYLILQELDNNSVELSTVKRYLDNNENINPSFKIEVNSKYNKNQFQALKNSGLESEEILIKYPELLAEPYITYLINFDKLRSLLERSSLDTQKQFTSQLSVLTKLFYRKAELDFLTWLTSTFIPELEEKAIIEQRSDINHKDSYNNNLVLFLSGEESCFLTEPGVI